MTPGSSTFLVRLPRNDPRVFNFFSKIAKFCLCRGWNSCPPDQELGPPAKELATSLRFSKFWQASSPALYFLHPSSFRSPFLKKCYQKKEKKYEVLTLLLGVKNVCPLIFFPCCFSIISKPASNPAFFDTIFYCIFEKKMLKVLYPYIVFFTNSSVTYKKNY